MANQWKSIESGVPGVMVGHNRCDQDQYPPYIEVQAALPTVERPFKLTLTPWKGEVMARLFGKLPDSDHLVDYTYDCPPLCAPDELRIDDTGLLTAVGRPHKDEALEFRAGFTVQLSPKVVEPIRIAIAAAFKESILERGSPATSGI